MGRYSSYKEKELREMERYCYYKKEEKRMSNYHKCDRCKKHDHCVCHKDKKRKSFVDVIDFDCDTKHPNIRENEWFKLPKNTEKEVASITLRGTKKGDIVWLNGVFGIDNDKFFDDADIKMRVYRGSVSPTNKIYEARIEVAKDNFDKFGDQVVEPLSHCDVIYDECDKKVEYIVTLQADECYVFLTGPVTFSGMLINKNCGH